MECCLCGKPVGFPVQVPTDDGFLPAHRTCAVAAITGRTTANCEDRTNKVAP